MSKIIYKYPLSIPLSEIAMPRNARILSVGAQNVSPILWAIVDPDCPDKEWRIFEIHTTGFSSLTENPGEFLGTFQLADSHSFFVGHVFETTGIQNL